MRKDFDPENVGMVFCPLVTGKVNYLKSMKALRSVQSAKGLE